MTQQSIELPRPPYSYHDEDGPISVNEYWKTLKRRRYLFAIPAIFVALFVLTYAIKLPDQYRSTATILIEDQNMPKDIVGSTITNYALQQIKLISQRIFTNKNIKEINQEFKVIGLRDKKGRIVSDSILESRFRNRMSLQFGSADSLAASNRQGAMEVAFTLSFKHPSPKIAQRVTEKLVSLFISENQRSTATSVTEVSGLLSSAIDEANNELKVAESNLASFRAVNEGALPELYQFNQNVINRSEQELSNVNQRITQERKRKIKLSSELAALNPSAPVRLATGEVIMSDRERLRTLLIDFRRKSAIYEDGHPDLVRLQREIETLKQTVGGAQSYAVIQEELRRERERLAGLRIRYSQDHPDIRSSENTIANLESQLASIDATASASAEVADNPAYILVNTQLQGANLELQGLIEKRNELQGRIAEYEALIKRAPQVQMRYDALVREAENARTKYNDLRAKLRAADVAAVVGEEIAGQRFTVIEPPRLPTEPEPQYRGAIVVLGLFLAAGVGAGVVILAEYLDKTIRSPRILASVTGSPPLAVIPYLDNSADLANIKMRRLYVVGAFLVGVSLYVVYIMSLP